MFTQMNEPPFTALLRLAHRLAVTLLDVGMVLSADTVAGHIATGLRYRAFDGVCARHRGD